MYMGGGSGYRDGCQTSRATSRIRRTMIIEDSETLALRNRIAWLYHRADFWNLAVGANSVAVDELPDLQALQCVSALWHLKRCLEHIARLGHVYPANLQTLVAKFLAAHSEADLTEARDSLEHIEDRVADLDMGRHPAFVHDRPVAEIFPVIHWERGLLRAITILDSDFDLTPAIRAARDLRETLFVEAQSQRDELLRDLADTRNHFGWS